MQRRKIKVFCFSSLCMYIAFVPSPTESHPLCTVGYSITSPWLRYVTTCPVGDGDYNRLLDLIGEIGLVTLAHCQHEDGQFKALEWHAIARSDSNGKVLHPMQIVSHCDGHHHRCPVVVCVRDRARACKSSQLIVSHH